MTLDQFRRESRQYPRFFGTWLDPNDGVRAFKKPELSANNTGLQCHSSITNCRGRGFSRSSSGRKHEQMVEDGEQYSRTSGVELKFDADVDVIDWDSPVAVSDFKEITRRCMAKYPSMVPSELSLKKAESLIRKLPGVPSDIRLDATLINQVLEDWKVAYQENLDKVMFDNLSSYEP